MPRDARGVGQRVLSLIDKFGPKGRFFLFVHFGDVDVNGHKYGESSPEYDGALVSLDTWLGRMVAQLKTDGLYDHTAVYVTADHGFDVGTTHHAKATHIFLASNDPQLASAGEQRDVTPTILQALGVDITTITPPLPGKSLRKKD
jgi:arylsulfatase A-like enzyme